MNTQSIATVSLYVEKKNGFIIVNCTNKNHSFKTENGVIMLCMTPFFLVSMNFNHGWTRICELPYGRKNSCLFVCIRGYLKRSGWKICVWFRMLIFPHCGFGGYITPSS
jgi:hypothetical protein